MNNEERKAYMYDLFIKILNDNIGNKITSFKSEIINGEFVFRITFKKDEDEKEKTYVNLIEIGTCENGTKIATSVK